MRGVGGKLKRIVVIFTFPVHRPEAKDRLDDSLRRDQMDEDDYRCLATSYPAAFSPSPPGAEPTAEQLTTPTV